MDLAHWLTVTFDVPALNTTLLLAVLGFGVRWFTRVNAGFAKVDNIQNETIKAVEVLRVAVSAHERLDDSRFEDHDGRITRLEIHPPRR